ncbi:hypothetical protein ABZ297_38960 [Nonomuraea sp. NPDC005983]|uniref:hypothetical protein n=1 Tax=Nonomuraea sp. NPDC005983 TaxID=3155595 RepID=UPI0033BB370F
MSIVRSTTVALSAALAFGATVMTGVSANAEARPAAKPAAAQSAQQRQIIGSGATMPGVGWVSYGANTGIYLDVDTTSAHFTSTPAYVTTIGGAGAHWTLTGTSAIYNATPTGFRIYVRWADGGRITPADAVQFGWYVGWFGVQNQ